MCKKITKNNVLPIFDTMSSLPTALAQKRQSHVHPKKKSVKNLDMAYQAFILLETLAAFSNKTERKEREREKEEPKCEETSTALAATDPLQSKGV